MVFRGEHDRRRDRGNLVPFPPYGSRHPRHIVTDPVERPWCCVKPRETIRFVSSLPAGKEGMCMQRRPRPLEVQIPARPHILPVCRAPNCLRQEGGDHGTKV